MVVASSDFSRALAEPLQAIQDIFEKDGNEKDFTRKVAKHFESLFNSNEAKAKITPLTRKLLANKSKKPAQIVRWRCMIQDTNFGNELMPRRHKDTQGRWKSSLFGANTLDSPEESEQEANFNPSELSSVNTLYGVSLPGQANWSEIAYEKLDPTDDSTLEAQLSSAEINSDDEEILGSPSKLPTGKEMGSLLKVYDEDLAESIRVAQVVDVIGILDECTLPSAEWEASEEASSGEASASHPAIHVVSMQKAAPVSQETNTQRDVTETREALVAYLTQALQGDTLAAEWLLLSLIARLHTRTATHTLGPFSMNLSSFPSSQGKRLFSTLSNILPLVVDQSLELTHLNDKDTHFAPRGSGDEAGLSAGRLQLVDGTLLLIDENTMQEGQLKENGIENIRALSTLMTTKKLTYAFPYSNLEMHSDINCVILSQGKSFLPFDVQIPLQPSTEEQGRAAAGKGSIYSIADYRSYLSMMQSRSSQAKYFNIPTDVSERIQTDFVEGRNAKQKSNICTQEDLSRTLQIARLSCLSRGEREMKWEHWEQAKDLDAQRLLRLT